MPERSPNGAGQDKRFQSVAQSKTIVDVNPIPKSYHNHITPIAKIGRNQSPVVALE
jgi:hypothetical protein